MTRSPNTFGADALPASPWVVRSEMVEAQQQADDVLSAARAEAARVLAEAVADSEGLREKARQAGLHDGATAVAALIAEVRAGLDLYREARESELGSLAFALAHRILGAFPEEDRLVRAVRTALDEHRNASGLRLRTNRHMAAVLRTALDEAGAGTSVTIDADDRAATGECTLIHPRGRIAVGPIDQLLTLLTNTSPGGGVS